MSATKRCARCQTVKPRQFFAHQQSSRDGLGSWCRGCHSAYNRERHNRTRAATTPQGTGTKRRRKGRA